MWAGEITTSLLHATSPIVVVSTLCYENILEPDEQTALLRPLTTASDTRDHRPIFAGVAMFGPVEADNTALVKALVDLTARNSDGDTALHVAAAEVKNTELRLCSWRQVPLSMR